MASQLCGVEIHAPSVAQAAARLQDHGFAARIIEADFFDGEPDPKFDAAVGNPPYVRYQDLTGVARSEELACNPPQSRPSGAHLNHRSAGGPHCGRRLRVEGR